MTAIEAERARFSMERVVTRTFEVLGDNFLRYAVLAAIFEVPPTFVSFMIARAFPVYYGVFSPLFIRHYSYLLLNGIFSMLISYFLRAALVHGTITSLNGNPATIGECLSTVIRASPRLFGIGVIVIFGYVAGLVLLVVPGFILLTVWSVAIPACIVENRNVGSSLSRSAELTRSHRWSIFGLLIAVWLFGAVASLAARAVSGQGLLPGTHAAIPSSAIYWLAMALASIVIAPINAVGIASTYYELRTIKEGIGPEQLAAVFA